MSFGSNERSPRESIVENRFSELPSLILDCTMCFKKEEPKSYCTTCHRYLCDKCEYAHKIMICFKMHHFFPLNNKKTPAQEHEERAESLSCDEINVQAIFKAQYSEGKKQLENTVKLLSDLEETVQNLQNYHLASIKWLNDTYNQFEAMLRKERDNLIVDIEKQHSLKLNLLLNHKTELNGLVEDLTFKLSNIQLIVANNGEKLDCLDKSSYILNGNSSKMSSDEHNSDDTTASSSIASNYNTDNLLLGCFKFQFGLAGRRDGHLWHPRKIAYLPHQQKFVVCDRGYERSRMQLFSGDGQYLKKIHIQFIDIVAGMSITENEDIVVVDSVTPTVFIIGANDFLRSIDCSDFMIEPSDIEVRGKEIYICDFKGHKVVVIDEDGQLLREFGSHQVISFPNGLDISPTGDVLVGDSHGNFFHVAVFSKDGNFITEFRCPFVKVSRCCGLKISSQGRLITVDKNYHHVIILELDALHFGLNLP